jgi:hypothetical protein
MYNKHLCKEACFAGTEGFVIIAKKHPSEENMMFLLVNMANIESHECTARLEVM